MGSGVLAAKALQWNTKACPSCIISQTPSPKRRKKVGMRLESQMTPDYWDVSSVWLQRHSSWWLLGVWARWHFIHLLPSQKTRHGKESRWGGDRLFLVVPIDRVKGNGCKLNHKIFHLSTGKIFYNRKIIKHWKRVPRGVEGSPFVAIQISAGHGPEQSSLGDPALSQELDWTVSSDTFPAHCAVVLCHAAEEMGKRMPNLR